VNLYNNYWAKFEDAFAILVDNGGFGGVKEKYNLKQVISTMKPDEVLVPASDVPVQAFLQLEEKVELEKLETLFKDPDSQMAGTAYYVAMRRTRVAMGGTTSDTFVDSISNFVFMKVVGDIRLLTSKR